MTDDPEPPQETLLDRADVRVVHEAGVVGAWHTFRRRVGSGELGALPVVVGLVIIWTVFQTANPVFLSSNNLVNLLFDSSTVGVISLGVVCVLLLGEIDLSVGSVSGLASAIVGVLWINHGLPAPLALLAAVATGAAIGAFYAFLYTRFGMPSFVATLAGLLAFLGLQLFLLGPSGSINLTYGSAVVNLGQQLFVSPLVAYLVIAIAGIATLVFDRRSAGRRGKAGLSAASFGGSALKVGLGVVLLEAVVAYLNHDRGVPVMFAFFVALVVLVNYVLKNTQAGRHAIAIGGNREAARRAGINVSGVYFGAFVTCSSLAAVGGILSAARLASSSQQAGTGDVNLNAIAAAVIGGTSLFGGRGSAYSALLGIVVIQSIASGLTLLDLSSSLRYMITGAVLAIAVIVDSLARRSRVSHGRA